MPRSGENIVLIEDRERGMEVLAKRSHGERVPVTYTTRTQALRKARQLGEGWDVYRFGTRGAFKVARKTGKPGEKDLNVTRLYAVRFDETANWNMESLQKQFGKFCPVRIYGVYIAADNERTFIASTQPSAYLEWVYNTWEFAPDIDISDLDDNEREIISGQIYDVLNIENPGESDYFDFRDLERQLDSPRDSRYLDIFYLKTGDNEDPERKDAWEEAREYEQGNPHW